MIFPYETPISFNYSKSLDGVNIVYHNLIEISQGGPEIGTIKINDMPIKEYKFGGPCLIDKNIVYLPVFAKKFLGFGFRIAKINTNNMQIEIRGDIQDLIFLNRVEENYIYYFEDLNKEKIKKIEIF